MCVRIAPWILTLTTFVMTGPSVEVRADEDVPARAVLEEAVAQRLDPAEANDEEASSNSEADAAEVIRERYANRSVKIERTVIRDEEDNYVNHGPWRMWDTEGDLVAEGAYRNGKREGVWTGWYLRHETKLLSQRPYNGFNGPFVSQATFQNGRLNGTWTISDAQNQKISDWDYQDGVRHGKCVSWYSNGNKMQEIDFQRGEIHGSVRQWSADGEQTTDDSYQHGRRLGRKTEHYANNQKKSEGDYRFAPRVVDGEDDWWNLQLAGYVKRGEDQKHGDWKAWFPNGQLKVRGKFAHGEPINAYRWTWWHPNGQKAADGVYKNGEQEGHWTWWHANGQKKLEGTFQDGAFKGIWIWWEQDGKVAHKEDYRVNDAHEVLPASPEDHHSPEAATPEVIAESGEGPNVLVFPRTAELQDSSTIQE